MHAHALYASAAAAAAQHVSPASGTIAAFCHSSQWATGIRVYRPRGKPIDTLSAQLLVDCRRERFDMIRAATPGRQGATRENSGHIRLSSNAARQDAPPGTYVSNR